MNFDLRGGLAFGLLWVATCLVAYRLGLGGAIDEPALPVRSPSAPASAPAAGAAESVAEPPAGAGAPDARITALRGGGAVARFISYSKRLSDEELARLLPEITERMSAAEVRVALRRLLEEVPPGRARRIARFELIDRWGQLDARSALLHLQSEEDELLRVELTKRAIKGWASVDPEAAHAFVNSKEDLPDEALRSVWWGMAETQDLARTLEFVPELGPGSNRYSEPHEIWDAYMTLHEWYAQDPETVTAWVEGLPEGELRTRTLHSMIDQWARHDPGAALDWVDEHASVSDKTEAYVEIAESWARHDPEAAVAWASTLPPDTPELERIYERMFTRFLQYDYDDAADYLVEQEPSPNLDTAFEVYIDKVKGADPAASMVWAESITDESRRLGAMAGVANVWRESDPAALQEYVEGSGLSAAQREALLGK